MTSGYRASTKAALRDRCRQYRAALDVATYDRLSNMIIERALKSGAFDTVKTVHIYWPIPHRREIDTRSLIARLDDAGVTIVIPAVDETSHSPGRMVYHRFAGTANMRRNTWGTYEPIAEEAVPGGPIDLIVAPALAADRTGIRLGYGGGFYDRFLKEAQCPALALVYSDCLFDVIPHDRHDVPVGMIVTEDELVQTDLPATWQAQDRNQ